MREYKFRGRDGDDWYYGSLFVNSVGQTAICAPKSWWMKPVKAETVGEYTGLKDCEGREIYEGDIIESVFADYRALVAFRDGMFVATWGPNTAYQALYGVLRLNGVLRLKGLRVIGNIHDNPELLEMEA